jgi:hypothetical protein
MELRSRQLLVNGYSEIAVMLVGSLLTRCGFFVCFRFRSRYID